MDEAEIAMLTDVIRSGRLGKRTGTKVRQLEEAFARRYGVRHAVA